MAFETQVEADGEPARAGPEATQLLSGRDGTRALIVIALAVTAYEIVRGLSADTSWLLTVADRWIGGARLYADIQTPQPPGAVFPFVPVLLISRFTGISADAIAIVLTALLALGVIEAVVRSTVPADMLDTRARSRLAFGAALLILPVSMFAAPEHLSVILLVPLWAVMIGRAEGRSIPLALLISVGIAAGLAISIKVQFFVALLLPALAVARARRDFACLFALEYWLVGLVVGLYAAMVALVVPAYAHDMVSVIADLYRPVREPLDVLIRSPAVLWSLLAVMGLWLAVGGRIFQPRLSISLLAASGFWLTIVEQGKGFGVDYYPMVAVLVPAIVDRGIRLTNDRFGADKPIGERIIGVASFLMMAVGLANATLWLCASAQPTPAIASVIRQSAVKPKMLAISPHISIGHPLTRNLGGTWVGSTPNAWMTLGALYKLGAKLQPEAERLRLIEVIGADKARTAADIALGKPDAILVEHDDLVFPAWFGSESELVSFLPGYRRASTVPGGLDVWVRTR